MGISTKNCGVLKLLLIIAALFIILASIKTATNILVPFLLSTFIAIICNPLIAKAGKYKIPKGIAVVFVIVLFVTIALSLAGLVGNSLNELSRLLPEYRAQLEGQFVWITEELAEFNIQISSALLIEYFDPPTILQLSNRIALCIPLSHFAAINDPSVDPYSHKPSLS